MSSSHTQPNDLGRPAESLESINDEQEIINQAKASLDANRQIVHDELGVDSQELEGLLDEYVEDETRRSIDKAQADGCIDDNERQTTG